MMAEAIRVGFIINPIAGMGGAVGLKGTDGEAILSAALDRGAKRVAVGRASEALSAIARMALDIEFLTSSGEMGESAFSVSGVKCSVVHHSRTPSTAHDTKEACRTLISNGAELIVFVGGDGTARDIVSEIGKEVPIIGVPSGVKMHSAVFANTPGELAYIVQDFSRSRSSGEAEVLDIDENAFREGVVRARLYGIARVPVSVGHVQEGKQTYSSGTAADEADEIGHYLKDVMEDGYDYVLGPGSTTAAIARAMGQPKSLLGVDIYLDGKRIVSDASESDIINRLETRLLAKIIVSPIGAQGFFFGRGNQQISPRVIEKVGVENVIVVSTPSKLASTQVLRVDTGDQALDERFRGTLKVVTGYKRRKLVRVV
jgi:predicted polyphosphate/ATP-dependent NAD kinase